MAVTRQDNVLGSRLYLLSFSVLPWRLNVKLKIFNFSFFRIKTQISFSLNFFYFNFLSDAHDPVVDCKPGQIMAQFFATRGELTVLVS
jgi:hypothetical protein